jgi:hypothetical protein
MADIFEDLASQSSEIKKAGQRYAEIRQILAQEKDKELLGMLDSLVNLSRQYIRAVIEMEAVREKLMRRYVHYKDYHAAEMYELMPLEIRRRDLHNSVIHLLINFNSELGQKYKWKPEGKIPIGGIFTLDPAYLAQPFDWRAKIADWAYLLIQGLGHPL